MEIIFNEGQFGANEISAAKQIFELSRDYFTQFPCEGRLTITRYLLPPGYVERDIDILVMLEISEGSSIQVPYDGGMARLAGGFIFNIEVKEHGGFEYRNGSIQVRYQQGNVVKDATKQAWDIKNNLLSYLRKQGLGTIPLVVDILFFPNCSEETTIAIFGNGASVPMNFMDHGVSMVSLLAAAIGRNGELLRFNRGENAGNVAKVREFLEQVKSLPRSIGAKFELFAVQAFVGIASALRVGQENVIKVTGPPGSGKTILMLGKALDLANEKKSCLYLTYNRQLVLDLERFQYMLRSIAPASPFLKLRLETWDSFVARIYGFHNYVVPMGTPSPNQEGKAQSAYTRYQGEKGREIFRLDEEARPTNVFKYSQVSYVFVDEAQDLPPAIYKLLRALYGSNICLAFGDLQEYGSMLEVGEVVEITMNRIFRQRELPTKIVTAYIREAALNEGYQIHVPVPPELIGGKATVYTGPIGDDFYNNVLRWLGENGLNNYDLLHLHVNAGDAAANTKLPHYKGGEQAGNVTLDPQKFRYFHYNSCRGLEGSIVVYEKIDQYYEWCARTFGEENAKKRLFVALTRVRDYAVFTFQDLNHWLYTQVLSGFTRISNVFSGSIDPTLTQPKRHGN